MSLRAPESRPSGTRGPAVASGRLRSLVAGAVLAALACAPPAAAANAIVTENALPGSPPSQWDVAGAGDPTIQGFASDISYAPGERVSFRIRTTADAYTIRVYRLGYYGGDGARHVGDGVVTAALPQAQPDPLTDAVTGLVDCGNWAESGHWDVPANAVSGVYVARLERNDTFGASHVVFVVRDDAGGSDLLFKTADATWQAYNVYGGNSLYVGSTSFPAGHAAKVSYNRPFLTRSGGGGSGEAGQDWLFNAEFPMIRWLEANGYDVSYTTDVDTDRRGGLLTTHRALLCVGHDEYWSAAERAHVEAARDSGLNLAFLDGNEVYWKTRWEASIDTAATPYRTLVCYKEGSLGENTCGGKCDPLPGTWTGLWRDGCAYPSADGCRPENALTGQISWGDGTGAITVPAACAPLRFWRGTPVAALATGQSATLAAGSLGYEFDWAQYPASAPPGRVLLSSTTLAGKLHQASFYRAPGGALVFGAGTVQWSWGLDGHHDRGGSTPNAAMQQATVNLLADMGAQPGSLQPGLVAAAASTDTLAPRSVIASPLAGDSLQVLGPVTITGTASDEGGVVAGVDVSVDGGATWRPATGTTAWSYAWTPQAAGTAVVLTRAFDDSGIREPAGAPGDSNAAVVTVYSPPCPCSLFPASAAPEAAGLNDAQAIELGMRFRAATDGFVTGLRFYKGAADAGAHVGQLYSNGGALLGEQAYADETASGWQSVTLLAPVAVHADTTYVAAVHSAGGGYVATASYFTHDVVNGPLRALADGLDGGNGVYRYTAGPAFPDGTFGSTNYWVDVVFVPAPPDTARPHVAALSPAPGTMGVPDTAAITATFACALDPASVSESTFTLLGPGGPVPATVSWDSTCFTATLRPASPLADSTTYAATLHGGAGPCALRCRGGGTLAADTTWSFTSLAPSQVAAAPGLPRVLRVSAAPNPARGETWLLVDAPAGGFRQLDILDVTGRVVRHVAAGSPAAGRWTFRWPGRDDAGRALPMGCYFARLVAEGHTTVARVVLLR